MTAAFALTLGELAEAGFVAVSRQRAKRAAGVPVSKIDRSRTALDVEMEGVLGEFAAAKWLGVEPDTVIHGERGDAGWDMVSRKGKTVDIKSTGFPNGRLVFDAIEKFKADVALLAVVSHSADVVIVGWVDRATFAKRARLLDLGYGEKLVLDQKDLLPLMVVK